MYSVTQKELSEKSINFMFINRELKDYIHIDLNPVAGKIEVVVHKSKDGLNMEFPVIGNAVVDSMPASSGDILKDAIAVGKHFKKNGYKEVNTLTQTKNGIKFS